MEIDGDSVKRQSADVDGVDDWVPSAKRRRPRLQQRRATFLGLSLIECIGRNWIADSLSGRGREIDTVATAYHRLISQSQGHTNSRREVVFVRSHQTAADTKSGLRCSNNRNACEWYPRIEVLCCLIGSNDETPCVVVEGRI